MPDLTLEQAARDVLAAYDAIGMGPGEWKARDRDAFARLREVLPEPGKSPAQRDRVAIPFRALWGHAAPASNAASDARDLSMILTRALATHGDGFGPDELSALYSVAGMVTDKVTEAADKADEVCRLVDPLEAGEKERTGA